jgi:hypothetical protein
MKRVLASLAMALAIPSLAHAQAQSAAQQDCINTLNKGMLKIASTQGKLATKCIAGFAKGKEAGPLSCYESDPKLTDLGNDVCEAGVAACTEAPSFGPANCTNLGSATDEPKELAADLYDIGIDQDIALCADSKDACICQAKTTKATFKVFGQVIKSFNACKKLGLRDEDNQIDSSADLAACLGSDPQLKIENAGIKLGVAVDVSCTGLPMPYGVGECAGETGTNLSACLVQTARCRACRTVRLSDNLTIDCDLFDDASPNTSCVGD